MLNCSSVSTNSRVFSKRNLRYNAQFIWINYLIRFALFYYAILMYSGFMRKCILANNCFVSRYCVFHPLAYNITTALHKAGIPVSVPVGAVGGVAVGAAIGAALAKVAIGAVVGGVAGAALGLGYGLLTASAKKPAALPARTGAAGAAVHGEGDWDWDLGSAGAAHLDGVGSYDPMLDVLLGSDAEDCEPAVTAGEIGLSSTASTLRG